MRIELVHPPLSSHPRPQGAEVDTIVLHATAGREEPDSSAANAIATLRERGLAYHYIVAKDGTIHKCVSASLRASHAGSSYGPHEQAAAVSTKQYGDTKENRAAHRVDFFAAGCSVNDYSIGISFVNMNDGVDPYPEAQLAAAHELIAQLAIEFPKLALLTTHFEVSPRRKDDPKGPGFDLDHFAKGTGLGVWRFPRSAKR